MRRTLHRILAFTLTLALLFSMLPVSVFASLLDNDPAYNKEILSALSGLVGSEDEAKQYYQVLERYGLLDEDGNMSESWSIEMEGRDVELDELKEILEGEYDPDKYLWVDGTAVHEVLHEVLGEVLHEVLHEVLKKLNR